MAHVMGASALLFVVLQVLAAQPYSSSLDNAATCGGVVTASTLLLLLAAPATGRLATMLAAVAALYCAALLAVLLVMGCALMLVAIRRLRDEHNIIKAGHTELTPDDLTSELFFHERTGKGPEASKHLVDVLVQTVHKQPALLAWMRYPMMHLEMSCAPGRRASLTVGLKDGDGAWLSVAISELFPSPVVMQQHRRGGWPFAAIAGPTEQGQLLYDDQRETDGHGWREFVRNYFPADREADADELVAAIQKARARRLRSEGGVFILVKVLPFGHIE
eukprot:NODE_4822_length_1842_cov_3.300292.p1 GENE.NODE_4822_length_1842_cov_3.300292~~NODE_4822_length_1842_cov_3.300292.p1  ORF type:complete len:276 (+),score=97.85 NODE_4822_length_1842_cov_3.300292:141-968(+)